MEATPRESFQSLILTLQRYWADQGCAILQPYDMPMGAGTFHPATFLRALSPKPWRAAYVQPSRRPTDGRYGENPNRLGHYYQFQMIWKPSPPNIQELYLGSLSAIGLNLKEHDVRFVEDDWESPTLGASGLGWEVWLDGMEVSQFTYFQQCGGMELASTPVELTYGLERLAMYLQKVDRVYDLVWVPPGVNADGSERTAVSYGDVFEWNELEQAQDNFENSDVPEMLRGFDIWEAQGKDLVGRKLPLPAYDCVMMCSHTFNMLQARGAISVAERAQYMKRVRDLAILVGKEYVRKDAMTMDERRIEAGRSVT